MTSRRRRAAHEAAHTAQALYFGHDVTSVSVVPFDRYGGAMFHNALVTDTDPEELICVSLAGRIGEQYLCGVPGDDDALAIGASQDTAFVQAILDACCKDQAERDRLYRKAEHLATHIVRVYAPLITVLAAELERRDTLTADEVRELIQHHQGETR